MRIVRRNGELEDARSRKQGVLLNGGSGNSGGGVDVNGKQFSEVRSGFEQPATCRIHLHRSGNVLRNHIGAVGQGQRAASTNGVKGYAGGRAHIEEPSGGGDGDGIGRGGEGGWIPDLGERASGNGIAYDLPGPLVKHVEHAAAGTGS